jgi:hypothetical protein
MGYDAVLSCSGDQCSSKTFITTIRLHAVTTHKTTIDIHRRENLKSRIRNKLLELTKSMEQGLS